jgi:hypothetical protein
MEFWRASGGVSGRGTQERWQGQATRAGDVRNAGRVGKARQKTWGNVGNLGKAVNAARAGKVENVGNVGKAGKRGRGRQLGQRG